LVVTCRYFLYENREEDRILQKLVEKTEKIYRELGGFGTVLNNRLVRSLYLIARLCLYGAQASRLHEDLVVVCARWDHPGERRGGLRPIDPAQLGEEEALRRLDEALLAGQTARVPDERKDILRTASARDVAELVDHLKAKARKVEAQVRRDLLKTGAREAEKTRKLLEGLRQRIHENLARRDQEDEKLRDRLAALRARATLHTGDPAATAEEERIRRERASERRAMLKLLDELEIEIRDEPGRVEQSFQTLTVRLEPVGMVYLWPEMG
jgi:hypothetical protein